MKNLKYLLFVLMAGTCTGIFFYTRSLSSLRLYETTWTDSSIIWAFSSLTNLTLYAAAANLLLLVVWLMYSWGYSVYSGEEFTYILQLDAYTYLPLCILGLSLLQFNTLLTYHFEGLLLLARSAGYLLLLAALIAVYHLKVKNHKGKRNVPEKSARRVSSKKILTWKTKLVIFLVSFFIYALVGFRILTQLGLGGDEPHYLLITHSLLYDHDLAIRGNYKQHDYKTFFEGTLDVHLSIAKDGTRYSIHPIGMPILLLPGYALGGLRGSVLFMNFLAALLALSLFLIAFAVTQDMRLSLILWVVISFTPPLLIYSSQLYPEIPSALLLAVAYYLIQYGNPKKISHTLSLGGALAYLPWVQQRMILPAILLTIYHTGRIVVAQREDRRTKQHIRFAALPVVFLAVSGMIMAGYYYLLFKNPLPNAPYLSVGIKNVFSKDIFLKEGLLGLLFDQEAGLLIYAPYFLFLFAGVLFFFRQNFLQTVFLLLVISSIYIPCSGFTLKWRGSWSPVARYMVAMIPFLFVMLCVGLKNTSRYLHRYIFFFLCVLSFSWSYRFLHTPFSSLMRNNGINRTFEEISNLVDITRYFPSFTANSTTSFPLAGIWIALILALTVWMYRSASPSSSHILKASGKSHPLTPSFPEYQSIRNVKEVFVCYGIFLLGFFLMTFGAARIHGTATPSINKNRYLREFLSHFDYHAIASNQITREQPFVQQEIRFEYINREKYGQVNKHGERFIVSGPREPYSKGRYTVYFKMWIEDNSTDQAVATIDAAADRGSRVFSRKTVRGTDFAASGKYELIPLTFELPEDVNDLETRVFFHNRVNMRVKKIYIEPDLAELYYKAGLRALKKEFYEEAKTLFLRATSASNHPQALYQLARIAQRAEEWKHSIALLKQVIAQQPEFADAHYHLGIAFTKREEFQKARQYLEQATQLLATHLDAWKALQETYQKLDMEEHIPAIEKTIQTLYNPQYPYAVNFSNELMFLGYSARNSAPGRLHLEYYWKALSQIKSDYTIFVHFNNSKTKFQQDHLPQITYASTGEKRIYPTSQWEIGELIREEFDIAAPLGDFAISLGMWDPGDTKQRLPIISPGQSSWFKKNNLELKRVTVK